MKKSINEPLPYQVVEWKKEFSDNVCKVFQVEGNGTECKKVCGDTHGILKEHGQMTNGLRTGRWKFIYIGSIHDDSEVRPREFIFDYTKQDPINDPGNVISVMFYDGEYIHIRAQRSE